MSDEFRDLLVFLGVCVVGVVASGAMLGTAIVAHRLTWVAVAVFCVVVMTTAFVAAFRWLCQRRDWESTQAALRQEVRD